MASKRGGLPLKLVGERYGMLTVVDRVSGGSAQDAGALWRCVCDCGKERLVRTGPLRKGSTRSCGCANKTRPRRSVRDGKLPCSICGLELPTENFSQTRYTSSGFASHCKSCCSIKAREKKYGISGEQLGELIQFQHGRCDGCGEARQLCVDHDHKTGTVRGMLCVNCNGAIGYAKDNPLTLLMLSRYLMNTPVERARGLAPEESAWITQ